MAQTVLVADDSPTIQRRASEILTAQGFEVVTVSNGVAAIKKLPAVKPALVLADISMPGKDGYEVCDFVKSSPELSHVPVLLVESADELYNDQRAASVGADGKIRKPFTSQELLATIRRFLSLAEMPAVAAAPPTTELPASTAAGELPEVQSLTELGPSRVEIPSPLEAIPFAEVPLEETPTSFPEPRAACAGATAEEPIPLVAEFPLEMAPSTEPTSAPFTKEVSLPSEPLLVEEPTVAPVSPPPSITERTLVLRTPAELAEPVLSDELAPAPPAEVAEAVSPPTAELEVPVAEAAAVQTWAPSEVHASPAPETLQEELGFTAVAEGAGQATAEGRPSAAVTEATDTAFVYSVVLKVVSKMAPPILPAEVVQELARTITEEIIRDLSSSS